MRIRRPLRRDQTLGLQVDGRVLGRTSSNTLRFGFWTEGDDDSGFMNFCNLGTRMQ